MRWMWVLYDADCGFCSGCRRWLEDRPKLVELRFVAAGSGEVDQLFDGLEPALAKDQLLVISDQGDVYAGANAWIMCLWALREYRGWAVSMARPWLRPLARQVYQLISSGRYSISEALGMVADNEISGLVLRDPASLCGPDGPCQGP